MKSAKQAIVEVLAREGHPLRASEIAKRVVRTQGVELRGRTPAATVTAILSRENQKADGVVVRTAPGMYALSKWVAQALKRTAR
jgi:hypothetical protein